ncbi:hypothetical protein M2139_001452 [Enterococcus sp. PF1-24]|uniref:hypothetical protein n=1 Tax=unclassified Enterococcus TaxID=2608891 RepID=UPI002473CA0C|nr:MULTISPECIES: hypothetical protein [unclassified Enterococcus]MDH6364409.1 hypothetical protein [Enterococcus sp. PFB1-1]MDH6401568.1 hypothetical protein [Enterococcus sp. PF1-24]
MPVSLSIVLSIIFIFLGLYSFYTVFVAIKTLIHVKSGKQDELEKKMIFDALGYSMLCIAGLHIIQLIIGIIWTMVTNRTRPFIPIISAGFTYGDVFSNSSLHIEAIIFDCLVFSICHKIVQKKYND